MKGHSRVEVAAGGYVTRHQHHHNFGVQIGVSVCEIAIVHHMQSRNAPFELVPRARQ